MYSIVNGRRYSVSLYSSDGIGDPDFWAVGGGCEGVFPGILRFDGFDKMRTFPEMHTVKKVVSRPPISDLNNGSAESNGMEKGTFRIPQRVALRPRCPHREFDRFF
jgi:hypothetical protein